MAKNHFMTGVLGWWKRKSIREQIFLSMLFIIVLSTGILGTVAYRTAKDTIEDNYKSAYESTLKNSSRVIDMNMDGIIEECRGFLRRAEFMEALKSTKRDGKYTFSDEIQGTLKKTARTLTDYQMWVNSITFMDLNGHLYQLNNINKGTFNFYRYYSEKSYEEENWCKETEAAKGKELFWGKNVLHAMDDQGVCMTKYLIDPYTGSSVGYLVVTISKNLLARSLVVSGNGSQSVNYMIIDEENHGDAIYFTGEDEAYSDVLNCYFGREEKKQYLFSKVKNDTTGWSVVSAIAENELGREIKAILYTVVIWAAIIGIFSVAVSAVISSGITRPLKNLEEIIARVGKGERHITEEFDYSEVGQLGQKFKNMVNTNLELSEHLMAVKLNEREAELLLLQSQINPHFLYNTLDSLYFVAIMHEDDQLADMVMALSDNFKLALNRGSKFISIADSIKWVEGYIKLQNIRYNNRFTLYVDISRDILQRRILTFILQPFIENSMYHGLEPKIGKGKISVLGWQEGTKIKLVVEDDGVGMEDLSVLNKGYGIKNVKERIRLNYGEKYGVEVESERGKGTKVTITLPAD